MTDADNLICFEEEAKDAVPTIDQEVALPDDATDQAVAPPDAIPYIEEIITEQQEQVS